MNKYTKLTAKRLSAIVQLLEEGLKVSTICDLIEIHRNTYTDWYNKGQQIFEDLVQELRQEESLSKEEKLFLKFFKEARKSKAKFERLQLTKVRKSRSYQSATWLLERHNSEDWLKNSEKKVQIEDVTKRETFFTKFDRLYPNLENMTPFEKAEFYKKTLTPEQLEMYRIGAETGE